MSRSADQKSAQVWQVVIVDDSVEDRAEFRRLMLRGSDRRYEFVEAETGAEALVLLLDAGRALPTCLVLDHTLPDMDAPELLAALSGPDGLALCPVVVVTGDVLLEAGQRVLRAGAHDYLGKSSLTPSGFTLALENAVERWHMSHQLNLRRIEIVLSESRHRALFEAAHENEVRLQLALTASSTGIITWDWRTDEFLASREAQAILGRADGAPVLRGASLLQSIHADDRERLQAALRQSISEQSLYHCEFRIITSAGDVRWLETTGTPVREPGRDPHRMLGTVRDVSARHLTEQALRAALDRAEALVRSRDQLISLVSHDLRTPLGAMVLAVSALREQLADESRALDARRLLGVLDRMARQAERMERLIDELLDVARIRAGEPLPLSFLATDLVMLVRRMADEHARASPAHSISVHTGAERVSGEWDVRRLERVVNNLLSNAIKYSPGGGAVRIDIELVDDDGPARAILRVTDHGIGMTLADQERVFEWFARGDNTRQTGIQGTGIGLAGVRQIVEQHGGVVSVTSTANEGSTFTVTLPVAPPPGRFGSGT